MRRGVVRAFSMGYEGRSWDSFAELVSQTQVRLVADVRSSPRSRKPGFSAAALAKGLAALGVAYVSLPSLGCDGAARARFHAGGAFEDYAASYRRRIAEAKDDLERLVVMVGERPTLLLCTERDPAKCHRSLLAATLQERGIRVEEL